MLRPGTITALCALGAALLVPAARAQQAPAAADKPSVLVLPDTWYTQVVASSDLGSTVTYFWSKGDKLRSETVVAGRKAVTIVNGPTYYAYDLVQRTGIAVERAPEALAADAKRARPFGNEYETMLAQGAEKVRDEDVGGREAELYQISDGLGRRQLWVTRDENHLPLRILFYSENDSRSYETKFLEWMTGLPLHDDFFSPEPGVELTRLTLQRYLELREERSGQVGPVPVLYTELLRGR